MIVNENNYYSRLDKFLRKQLQNMPLSAIYKIIRKGKVLVNGKRVKEPSFRLEIGDEIEIKEETTKYNREKNNQIIPIKMDFEILYEDENLLIINKPAGIPIHPGKGTHIATLIEGLMYYGKEHNFTPYLVHRLDKHTSGVFVVAKNVNTARELNEIISSRAVEKVYTTLCVGEMKKSEVIKIPLDGKNAVTIYEKQKQFKSGLGYFSLLRVQIKTGRKHQIRKHLSLIGHPVIGDDLYGDKKLNRKFKQKYALKRYFLHCSMMLLYYNDKEIRINAPLPNDLKDVLKNLKMEE
ncbi:pseudouridine synthase [Thermosipho melanesiensis]|uniref:Pseudouridine synthase n=2 Tax=Thermosipho melanesiensis TaxID=46541 RepID=A6LLH9_THEM4|nr:RluA family pseudouridine synthase [Thermosipho melanesiensis]ABR30780.1 pseudouridine synthase, RluA family [Thermosipho melanesiensis BI429]APT73901.1 pseudouridine synthase [Thermosipho melanesiensis]OOC35841.1 pseudouridine synthase [Thermosipho melanesiensis]OOC38343.1 pseudouridine synthase [Thermosipho melanesiensis]OOC38804.1 pseudouridine synthase [Thermosipho melanesiensis]